MTDLLTYYFLYIGKSTLLNVLAGYLTPSFGKISYFGSPSILAFQSHIALVNHNQQLWPNLTVAQHIVMKSSLQHISRRNNEPVSLTLSKVGLDRLGNILVSKLSPQEKHRLSLLLSSIGNPQLVLWDEPTRGCDELHRHQIWNLAHEISQEATMIIASHEIEELENVSHRMAALDNGELKVVGSSTIWKSVYTPGMHIKFNICPKANISELVSEIELATQEVQAKVIWGGNSVTISNIRSFDQLRCFLPFQAASWCESWKVGSNGIAEVFWELAGVPRSSLWVKSNVHQALVHSLGPISILRQIFSMFGKDILYVRSHWKTILGLTFVISIIMTAGVTVFSESIVPTGEIPIATTSPGFNPE
jgi:ABC-type multidrug transport system ATPase subunit